jgi:hypothetical protein
MNNFERIKQMTVEEMAEYFDSWDFIGAISRSIEGIKQWLLEECE